jgi:hypothetical protein
MAKVVSPSSSTRVSPVKKRRVAESVEPTVNVHEALEAYERVRPSPSLVRVSTWKFHLGLF